MRDDTNREALRFKVGTVMLYAGILVMVYATLRCSSQAQGVKNAGSVAAYLGTARWQDSLYFVSWAFSWPTASAFVVMGVALRKTALSLRLAVALPLAFAALAWLLGFFITFPGSITPLFAVVGTASVVGVLITICLSAAKIRSEDPWPGFLRCLGYLSFGASLWFTCGLLTTPGALIYPHIKQDPAISADMAHKLQLAIFLGWVLTSLSFVLERRRARQRTGVEAEGAFPVPASPAPAAAAAARSAEPLPAWQGRGIEGTAWRARSDVM